MLYRHLILALFLLEVCSTTSAECARKTQSLINDDENLSQHTQEAETKSGPPGRQPTKHFVQTTFIFRDLSEDDRLFSHMVMEKLHQLRPKLKAQAKLTMDNENIDCAQQHFQRCREYPLKKSYHFFVVEDSVHGAAVYSIDRKLNKNLNAVEMALLDALSRHSLHPLVGYASKEVGNELGFMREVRSAELEKFADDNQKEMAARSKKSASSIFTQSPYETALLNERILELRRHDFNYKPADLQQFQGGELAEAIDSGRLVFVLFWSNVASVSSHTFELWSRVASLWGRESGISKKAQEVDQEEPLLGSVACHEQTDLCTLFAISHQNQHTLYAYKNEKLVATQLSIGDEIFYLNWMRMVAKGSLIQVNKIGLENAKKGVIEGFSENVPRLAVTIGVFPCEHTEEFKRYKKVAEMLNGRYHLVYSIDRKSAASISTYRPLETVQGSVEYIGNFDSKSLLTHVTHASLPSVFDIGNGFTTQLFFHASAKPLLVLLFDSSTDVEVHKNFVEAAGKSAMNNKARDRLYAQIDSRKSVQLDGFLSQINLKLDQFPALCLMEKDEIKCGTNIAPDAEIAKYTSFDSLSFTQTIDVDSRSAHPLKYIQLQQINNIFGYQEVALLPEPKLVGHHGHGNHHDMDDGDEGAISGCPMMAHLDQSSNSDNDIERDEL
uniref:Thioredoxin domain-containing protein n=1 Tax=Ditylenchus dipsaci TaxID=166011 RepID=A0A915DEA3_9BILA